MMRTPPRAARLLRFCLGDPAFETVTGDLDEEYEQGRTAAWYRRQALKSAAALGVRSASSSIAPPPERHGG